MELDKHNGNDYWKRVIRKKSKVQEAFELYDKHTPDKVRTRKAEDVIGYQEIRCRIIFDVKIDFTRKVSFITIDTMTEAPASLTYSSFACTALN